MSALPQYGDRMTEAEYLAFERESDLKHEYIDGTVVAMTGASEKHNLIVANVITALRVQLRGRGCKVYPSDMRVKVAATGLYAYPDISALCGEARFSEDPLDTLLNPLLIIEVLSPSTERYDRGEKFQHYRELPSLREYLLIAQARPHVERYALEGDGGWKLTDAKGLAADLDLSALGCTLKLAEVYEDVVLPDSAGG